MSADHARLVHHLKRIAKLAWDAQNENLSPEENEKLDGIIYTCLDLAGEEDKTVGQFTEGVM